MNVEVGRNLSTDQVWETDVLVVGSGAGGAIAAYELANAGRDVLILEEGPFLRPKEHASLRPTQHMRAAWRQGAMTAALGIGNTPVINLTMGRCVGGSSALTGGVCFRTPGSVLKTWTETRGLVELSEKNLEPFFDEIERRLHIQPVPEPMWSNSTHLFGAGLRKLGTKIKAIQRNTVDCSGIGQCNFGCPQGSKMSVDRSVLPEAMKRGARLVSDCLVERLVMEGSRVVGARGRIHREDRTRKGPRFEVRAKTVVVAAGGVHSPSLLQASGVGKRSRQVGRNLTVHPAFRMIARFDEPVHGWSGSLQSAFTDAYEHEGVTLMSVYVPPGAMATGVPGLGPEWMSNVEKMPYFAMFGGLVHDEAGGRVRKIWGREPLVTYRMCKGDQAKIPAAMKRLGETWLAAGAQELFLPILGHQSVTPDQFRALDWGSIPARLYECSSQHPLGTCRMGTHSDHSVVDGKGKVWDMDNLYVMDGSVIPTSLGVNPQETIMAMVTRLARGLAQDLPAGQ
jgi:choline dehydrogenase-like flavoprotein